MPSPFPGMDPYIEDPSAWSTVQLSLIVGINTALNKLLPKKYWSRIDARTFREYVAETKFPRYGVLECPREPKDSAANRRCDYDEPIIVSALDDEMTQRFVQIVALGDPDRVVTEIELLSPNNKDVESRAHEVYVERQTAALQSNVNFIEIDFLRGGKHTSAFPRGILGRDRQFDYSVCLHRANDRFRYEVWLSTLRQRLPRICVPIEPGVPDLVLDLQGLFECQYDESSFHRLLHYGRPLDVPLSEDDAVWSSVLLKKAGVI